MPSLLWHDLEVMPYEGAWQILEHDPLAVRHSMLRAKGQRACMLALMRRMRERWMIPSRHMPIWSISKGSITLRTGRYTGSSNISTRFETFKAGLAAFIIIRS